MYANREDGSYSIPKGQNISGSASWHAKCDLGITVHRTPDDEVEIHCWKSRFKWVGQQGVAIRNSVNREHTKNGACRRRVHLQYQSCAVNSGADSMTSNQKHTTELGTPEMHSQHSVMIEGRTLPRAKVMDQALVDEYLMDGLLTLRGIRPQNIL